MSLSTLKTIGSLGDGDQDAFLCPLFFATKLASGLIENYSVEGGKDYRAVGLNHLSDRINDARFPLRFFVGIRALTALLSRKYNSDPDLYRRDASIDTIRFAQTVSDIVYNLVELPAYIRTIGAPQLADYDGQYLGRVSCYIWLFKTVLEVIALYKQINILDDLLANTSDKAKRNELNAFKLDRSLTAIANLTDLPLAHHWAQEGGGYLNNLQIGALGSVGSIIRFYQWWIAKNTKTKLA